jgi:WD40 repeat protein
LWDAVTASRLAEIGTSDGENYTFSPSGRQILTRSTNSSGALLDALDGSLLATFRPGQLMEYKFSSKGDRLVVTTSDKAAALWNSATGDKIIDLAGPGQVDLTMFSPDASRLSVGSTISTGALWDVGTGTKLTDYGAKAQADGQVIFSVDGARMAMSSTNNFGLLLDAQTGRYLANLGGEGAVYYVRLSADGQRIATQSVYNTAAVWDGSLVPKPAEGPRLKTYVCSINYEAIGVFPGDVRRGVARPEGVDVELAQHLKGRPWHPCDWRGLLSLEGWGQMLRFWAVKIGGPWDYRCGEKRAFGGIDPMAAQLCPNVH